MCVCVFEKVLLILVFSLSVCRCVASALKLAEYVCNKKRAREWIFVCLRIDFFFYLKPFFCKFGV